MTIDGLKFFLTNPNRIYAYFASRGMLNWIPDKHFIKFAYRANTGKKLNLKTPKTFNEKLQWLKLYDRKPIYTTMVDKYEVKEYVADLIGEEYIIPTLGVWDRFEDIDFDALPEQFVLKCTHDSGGLVICRDKSKLDMAKAKNKIEKSLNRNYFWNSREWPYKNVKPRIIAEKYMEDNAGTGLKKNLPVYKFFCFDSEPKIIQVIQNDKQKNESIDYFDTKWNLLDLRQNYPNSAVPLKKPQSLESMLDLVRKLSENKKSFLRVDLYEINGENYFSEYTFYSDSGMAKFEPEKWDKVLGEWVKLPENSGGGRVHCYN